VPHESSIGGRPVSHKSSIRWRAMSHVRVRGVHGVVSHGRTRGGVPVTLSWRRDGAFEQDQTIGDILVYGFTHNLVFPLEMIDTILLVREPSSTFAAHEGILLSTLVLQVPVQVVVPVVGTLTMGTSEHTFRTAKLLNIVLSFPFPPFLGWLLGRVNI